MTPEDRVRAKAEIYGFISRMFDTPSGSFEQECRSEALLGAFGALDLPVLTLTREVTRMADYFETTSDHREALVEYTRLFRGPVKAEVYPYESMYTDGEALGRSALAVVSCYQGAGVQISGEFRDLPDHISAETEFMQYLCVREVQALVAEETGLAAELRLARLSFLKDHLGSWLPSFADGILQYATTPFYQSLARISRNFIDCEAADALREETCGSEKG